jgi:uncharacterized protein YyaL (SSP411 family)
MANALAHETSPYLLQHRHNPVDWLPWGEEALARARAEDRPLLVSIGYSACHWCHVMERECFENEEIAALMNAHFVCVKVDREERPDVDALYMEACQLMNGSGGWPLNVFVTPEQVPFYAGTYYPPEPRSGMPSWPMVLEAVAKAWDTQRDEIRAQNEMVAARLSGAAGLAPPDGPLSAQILDDAVAELRRTIRDATQATTTFGYGPRYLHSTGQLHKGGPDTGLFVQVVDDMGLGDPADELPIPGRDFGFGTLIRAQAAGDLAALEERGRRVVRLRLEEAA